MLYTLAGNTDTSMKYIQEHYFHYRADESTEILGKGRKVKPAEESLWKFAAFYVPMTQAQKEECERRAAEEGNG